MIVRSRPSKNWETVRLLASKEEKSEKAKTCTFSAPVRDFPLLSDFLGSTRKTGSHLGISLVGYGDSVGRKTPVDGVPGCQGHPLPPQIPRSVGGVLRTGRTPEKNIGALFGPVPSDRRGV